MSDHKVNKKIGLSYGEFTLGSSVEVETKDRGLAEDFLNRSLVRDALKKIGHMLFGERIEKNTIDTIVIASKKIKLMKKGMPIYELPMKFSVSLLESAGLEEDNFLRDRWSDLLANASTNKEDSKIEYVYILRELNKLDVELLNLLFKMYEGTNSFNLIKNNGFGKNYFIEDLKMSEEIFEKTTDNLIRLNLIKTGDGTEERTMDKTHIATHHKKGVILFTHLGLAFVRACRMEIEKEENGVKAISETIKNLPATFE